MPEPPDAGDSDSTENLVSQVLKDFGVLNQADTASEPVDRLLAITEDTAKTDALLNAMFPHGVRPDSSFYETLDELLKWITVGEKFDKAVGRLWARGLQRLEPARQEQLLSVYSD